MKSELFQFIDAAIDAAPRRDINPCSGDDGFCNASLEPHKYGDYISVVDVRKLVRSILAGAAKRDLKNTPS